MTTFTSEDRMFATPKEGDIFTEVNGAKFTVKKIFEVENDHWIEYYDSLEKPYYCRLEAFLQRYSITQPEIK